jgi:hypothetical protein
MSPIPLPTVHPFLLAARLSPWLGNMSLLCSEGYYYASAVTTAQGAGDARGSPG